MLVAGLFMMALVTFAQQRNKDVDKFLMKYKVFVDSVQARDTITAKDAEVFGTRFRHFTKAYHETYKSKMNNGQSSEYIELRTRYQKKMLGRTAAKVGNKIDSVSNDMAREMEKVGSHISGFFKGVFKKKK